MDHFDDIVLSLGNEAAKSYSKTPIPSSLDNIIRRLLKAVSQAEVPLCKELVSRLSEHHGFILTEYADRMAAYAVRTGQVQFVEEGLVALAIAYHLLYHKEVLLVLTLLYQSVKKIGLNPITVFKSISLPNTEFRQVVDDSLNSAKKDWSIEAMGYIEAEDQDGFRFRRTW